MPIAASPPGSLIDHCASLYPLTLIRALALQQVRLRDWWRVAIRELPSGIVLGAILGAIGIVRITLWQSLGLYNYGEHWMLVALTVGAALVGIVTFGSLTGSMLPLILQKPASAPFVATLVDVRGLVIYFSIALVILRGTML
jgi:magnesium transporter